MAGLIGNRYIRSIIPDTGYWTAACIDDILYCAGIEEGQGIVLGQVSSLADEIPGCLITQLHDVRRDELYCR